PRDRTENGRRRAVARAAPALRNRYGNRDRSSHRHGGIIGGIIGAVVNAVLAARNSAARLPERIAPSMVAGKPVFVQSPASRRLRQAVCAPGRRLSCAGVAAKVARRSRTICHGGKTAAASLGSLAACATSVQIVRTNCS